MWLPAGVLYVSLRSSQLMTGQRQVGTRSRPGACTRVVGQKTMQSVPGIPKPDAKLLAGCRERGRSQVFYIMRSSPPACSVSGSLAGGWVGPPFPEAPRIRKPACVSGGQSTAPADGSLSLWSVSIQDPWLSTGCGGTRGSQGVFYPDVPRCPGWKRNWAVSLKRSESSHPALFPACPPPPLLPGWRQTHQGVFASSLEGGGWPWEGLGRKKGRNGQDLGDQGGWRQRPLMGAVEWGWGAWGGTSGEQ